MASAVASPPTTEMEGSHSSPEAAMQMPGKNDLDLSNKSDRIPTPPTSEEMNKPEDHSSDLSDVEDDVDDAIYDDIKPDHYWDEENGGKIPVFKPTMNQFRDFAKLINAIDSYGMQSGIVKVVPPPEWRESLNSLDEVIKSIRVKNPITQEFAGTHGTYTQANIEKQRSYNLPQWKSLCEESNHKTPARKGDRRKAADEAKASRAATRAAAAPAADGVKRKPGRPPRKSAIKEEDIPEDSIESTPVPPTPMSATRGEDEEDDDETPIKEEPETKTRGRPGRKPGPKSKPGPKPGARGRQPKAAKDVKKSVASRRLHNQADFWEVDEEAFEDFDYHLENIDQFDIDRCKELEETYWKTINFGTPMYGADMPGSLFDDSVTSWNVAHLPNLLDVLGTKVPGVNTAYLYLGMWKATFAWHLEDVDLYSINYIHFGAPKQWYSISQADARKFEQAMRTLWPQDYKHCDQFLRHKTYLISPEKLKSQFGIKVNKLVHHEGEFVITYPYGYHSGFNLGYNCAESVNFATEDWLNYGRIAKKCLCEADSVWVDVNEIERKLRGEPTPEYYEVTDDESDEEEDVLPTPPPSVKGAKAGTKRKRGPAKKDLKSAPEKKKVKRMKVRVRAPSKEPCVLCPNDPRWAPLLPTDTNKQAHELCGKYTPETAIRKDEVTSNMIVVGINDIGKDRLNLRCNYCRSKKGAVVQCASKKCTRAFHATCLAAAGVLVEEGNVPTWDESGVEFYSWGQDIRCRFHRPKRPKATDKNVCEWLENHPIFRKYGKTLQVGDMVQAQMLDTQEIFAGEVLENRPGEGVVIVAVDPDPLNTIIEVEYKYLLTLDPKDSQRPKPSPDAKPLPEKFWNSKKHSVENRKDGVPSKGDPFSDPDAPQVWEEFNFVYTNELNNPFQKPVDMFKNGQKPGEDVKVWHFLGRNSTEAKPQFTHDLKHQVNNPKSNFLDSVRDPVGNRYAPLPPNKTSYNYGGYVNYSGSSIAPRPPVALQPRPTANMDKPYEYKPKTPANPSVYGSGLPYQKWQVNTPATQAQRANATAQGGQFGKTYPTSGFYPGTRPIVPYSPPTQSPASAGQMKPFTPTAYVAAKTGKSASPTAAGSPSTPSGGSMYAQAERKYSQQQPYAHVQAASTTPPAAPPPMHHSRPSTAAQAAKAVPKTSSLEYLDHIQKYPYLRNAYARRPEKYTSPYSSSFGFGAEYEMKLQRGVAARGYAAQARAEQEARAAAQNGGSLVSTSTAQQLQALSAKAMGVEGVGITTGGPANKPQGGTYQSATDFQKSIASSNAGPNVGSHAGPGWNDLLQRIGPQHGAPSNQAPYAPMTAPSATPYGTTAYAPMRSTTPPLPAPVASARSPPRPEHSPLSASATPAPVGLGIAGAHGVNGEQK